jgi:hypothetical protein
MGGGADAVRTRASGAIGSRDEPWETPPVVPREWQPYDPEWLIAIVRHQADPEEAWLAGALAGCTLAMRARDGEVNAEMHYFVDPSAPNQPGSPWQHQETICFEDAEAAYNIDVLRGQRVGGVEVLWHGSQRLLGFRRA